MRRSTEFAGFESLIRPVVVLVMLTWLAPARAQFVFDPPINIDFEFDLGPTSIAPADLNGDGLLDLFVTGRNVDGLAVQLMGQPGGGFGPPSPMNFQAHTDWVVARKFDADADLDLAVAVRNGLGLAAYLPGNGQGTFGPRIDEDVGRLPSHMIAEDFDADGDVDVVIVNSASTTGAESLSILRNNGAADFTTSQIIHLGQLFRGVATAFYLTSGDFDGDKDLDLAAALSIGYVAVLKNDGQGNFSRPVHYPAGTPTGIGAGDLDGDGDVDLAFADLDFVTTGMGVLLNQGDGVFGQAIHITGGYGSWYLSLADLDTDGRLDVIVTHFVGNIEFFRNDSQGPLHFAAPQVIQSGGFPRAVVPLDIDGDCDLDLLVANIGSHQVQIFRNQTPQVQPCRGGQSAALKGLAAPSGRRAVHQLPAPAVAVQTDLNLDGRVDSHDLAVMLGDWR